MFEWLKTLSDPNFMPHGHCYLWRPEVLWTHVVSDMVIAIAYYIIPVLLGIFLLKQRHKFPYPEILGLFVAFIFLCGTTHIFNIITTWYPIYLEEGWVKALTAGMSILTAFVLLPKLPQLIVMPGLQQAYHQLKAVNQSLESKQAEMELIYNASLDREERILELKLEVNELLKELDRAERYEVKAGTF